MRECWVDNIPRPCVVSLILLFSLYLEFIDQTNNSLLTDALHINNLLIMNLQILSMDEVLS